MRVLSLLLLAASVSAADRPRLLVVVSVDQLRPDTLTRFSREYTGGLKRLLDKGLRYRGVLDHAFTETGPGHSTMLTGCRPARTGIVANSWLDRETLQPVYCVDDPKQPVFGVAGKGRSPRLLLRDALGDWMKSADPRAKVFSVSAKDRAAILLGGRRPDGAYWLERRGEGFSTSAWYHPEGAPEWLTAFNRDGWLERLPEHWTYEPVDWLRADDDPRESSRFGRASPHPLQASERRKLLERVYYSPFGDALTLRLARSLVERFDLGGDEVTDLLCISCSSTDTVGHLYGPQSQEIRDCELRLDRALGELFGLLDRRGRSYVVVLTADHGVLPIPGMRRVDAKALLQELNRDLQKRIGPGNWYRFSSNQIWIDGAFARKQGKSVDEVSTALAAALRALEPIAAVHDRGRVESAEGGALLAALRNSYHPGRCGDLFVVPKERVLISFYGTGTSHGSPYLYDRAVPLAFLGPGIPAGERDREARTIDIAPTLAKLAGVKVPADIDGVVLPLN